jgi:hypothetical protein
MSMAMPLVLAMEALKLHLVAVLFFLALEAPLPWLPATLAFVSAAFLGMALRRLGSRLATRALVHLAGLALSVFAIYKAGLDPALEGFALPAFLVSSMLGGAFWIRGSWIGTRKPDHEFCLARFEEGIGVYLIVFLMASPSRIDVSTATRLSLSFFACGILSLGISKGREAATGGFSRLSPAAALVPLATGFTLASLGLFLVVPALQQGALRTRVAMKEGSSEFIRLLGLLLSKLFRLRPSSAGSAGNGGAPYQLADEGTAQASPLVNYLLIIILAVVFALVMVIIVVMLAQYFRAWASRSEGRSEPLDLSFLPAWLRALLHAPPQEAQCGCFRLCQAPGLRAWRRVLPEACRDPAGIRTPARVCLSPRGGSGGIHSRGHRRGSLRQQGH